MTYFYQLFTYHEVVDNDFIYIIDRGGCVLYFDICFVKYNDDTEYVGLFNDNNDVKHYVRSKYDIETEECFYYIDELNGNTEPLTQDSNGYCKVPDELKDSFGSNYTRTTYLEVYSKP